QLLFANKGGKGAVYHVYDMHRLDRIPRRYTVEAGKSLTDEWTVGETKGAYDLEVYGPNGYFHKFAGNMGNVEPEIELEYNHHSGGLSILLQNRSSTPLTIEVEANAYGYEKLAPVVVAPGKKQKKPVDLEKSNYWYDFTVKAASGFLHRFAGRVETGRDGTSDPAMATEI